MVTLTKIVCLLVLVFIILIVGSLFIRVAIAINKFHRRKCKHCGSNMEYKGLKGNKKDEHYLFHCEKCGSWENVSLEEMH